MLINVSQDSNLLKTKDHDMYKFLPQSLSETIINGSREWCDTKTLFDIMARSNLRLNSKVFLFVTS